MPVFDASHVDLVLSAHLHTYRDRGRIYDFRRAETGPYYIITGVAGDVRYPGAFVFPRCRLTPTVGSLCCVLREKYSFRVVTQSVFYLRVDHRQHKVKGQGEI